MSVIIKCYECGDELSVRNLKFDTSEDIVADVEPCKTCINASFEEGERATE